MKLVSTKRDLKAQKEREKSMNKPCGIGGEEYPYSTRLSLDKEVLDKLDISPKDFKVGQKVTVQAVAVVKSLRMVEGKDYDTNEVELQIQEIGVEKKAASSSMKDAISAAIKGAKDD
jgi:hypothetical protein